MSKKLALIEGKGGYIKYGKLNRDLRKKTGALYIFN
jgi:hypothetical protein